MLTMDEQERVDERPWDMFYHGPTVGTKCSYQNLELGHIRVGIAKVGFRTSHIGFENDLC